MAPDAPDSRAVRTRLRKSLAPRVRAAVRAGLAVAWLLVAVAVCLPSMDVMELVRRPEVEGPAVMLILGATVWAFARPARQSRSLRLSVALAHAM